MSRGRAPLYLFIECEPDHARRVLARLKQVPGVRDAHIVTGHYDIIAIIQAPDVAALGEAILANVQGIRGVYRTTTNLAVA